MGVQCKGQTEIQLSEIDLGNAVTGSNLLENDTLTTRDIAEWYIELHNALYDERPDCHQFDEHWFAVDGVERDRHWLILEVERMRQKLVTTRDEKPSNDNTHSAIFQSLRRISRLL